MSRILVVGSGGREHAILRALSRSSSRPELLCAPGNAGTGQIAENVSVATDDIDGLVQLAAERSVDLVVVGPEVPLVLGLADRLEESGIAVVGPSASAARLEGSKAFAKNFMERHGIPTARSRTFSKDQLEEATAYTLNHALPVVIKADGLAAGKGVLVAETRGEIVEGLQSMFDGAFGAAGDEVVVEEFMQGEEASVFVLTDGTDYVLLSLAQDHKRIGEGDTGLNTGGMGSYAPAPVVTDDILVTVESQIVRPVLRGMASEGNPYSGVLYVGLMITDGGPKVVEFNCRFGDPETQVVLPLLESDVVGVFEAIVHGRVGQLDLQFRLGSAACVVLASAGYPGAYEKGKVISGLEQAEEIATVFHAGTADVEGTIVTNGGRVLGVTGYGKDLESALAVAYRACDLISFEGKTYRRDIGRKGLAHLSEP